MKKVIKIAVGILLSSVLIVVGIFIAMHKNEDVLDYE